MPCRQGQDLADKLQTMDRVSLIRMLRGFHCEFDLDFTEDFLKTTSLARLRHIVLAAILQARRVGGPKRRS